MIKVNELYFYEKLHQQERIGNDIIMDRKEYLFKNTATTEIFGKLIPLANGWEYYLAAA